MSETADSIRGILRSERRRCEEAVQGEIADPSTPHSLNLTARNLCVEAYDRFVMGGWEPKDFFETVIRMGEIGEKGSAHGRRCKNQEFG